MTLDNAIERLKAVYENATKSNYVRSPLAYALYQVWKAAERERIENKRPADLTGKCGSCVFSAPTDAFGGSPCYVECTNADHLQQYCSRHAISKVRQRTAKACKRYTPRERSKEEW